MSASSGVPARPASFGRESLHMLAGLLVWGAHLTIVYAATAFACARPRRAMALLGVPLETVIAGTTVVALGAVAYAVAAAMRRRRAAARAAPDAAGTAFTASVGLLLGVLAFIGVVWTATAGSMAPACGAASP